MQERTFSLAGQSACADLRGDVVPIHVEPRAGRRLRCARPVRAAFLLAEEIPAAATGAST